MSSVIWFISWIKTLQYHISTASQLTLYYYINKIKGEHFDDNYHFENEPFGHFLVFPLYADTINNKKRKRVISNGYERHLKCEYRTILGSSTRNMEQYAKQLDLYALSFF